MHVGRRRRKDAFHDDRTYFIPRSSGRGTERTNRDSDCRSRACGPALRTPNSGLGSVEPSGWYLPAEAVHGGRVMRDYSTCLDSDCAAAPSGPAIAPDRAKWRCLPSLVQIARLSGFCTLNPYHTNNECISCMEVCFGLMQRFRSGEAFSVQEGLDPACVVGCSDQR